MKLKYFGCTNIQEKDNDITEGGAGLHQTLQPIQMMAHLWTRMKWGRGNLTWSRMLMSPVSWRPREVELIQLVFQVQQHPNWCDNTALRHFIKGVCSYTFLERERAVSLSKLSVCLLLSTYLIHRTVCYCCVLLLVSKCTVLIFQFHHQSLPRQSNLVFRVSVHQPHLNAAAIVQKSAQMLFCIRSNPETDWESKCPFFYLSLSSA